MQWCEIDSDKALSTIPVERKPIPGIKFSHRGTKMRTPYLVPLSQQAMIILKELYTWTDEYELILTGTHIRS